VLPALQQLVATEGLDDNVALHAYRALAGVGGPDATKTLLDLLVKHRNDDLQGGLVVALGRAKDADSGLAQVVRSSREGGDMTMMAAALQAALIQGDRIGPELKAELLRTVESTATLTAFPDEIDKLRVQGAAMPAAVAAGLVEEVLRSATTSGIQRDIALNALRQARGDDAARSIAAALNASKDEAVRRELTVALGETGSRAVTGTLVTLLGDEDPNTRSAAARALGQTRDAAAVKPILSSLSRATSDYDFARQLVDSLGTIGSKEALETLRKLESSKEAFWRQLNPFIRRAIGRIETGNPESERLPQGASEQEEK
jgi:HEAT repeat protein